MTFILSTASLTKLSSVHGDLKRVVKRAISLSEVDFTVGETLRTLDRQRILVKQGKSKTLDSRHLPNSSGICFAVDLHAWINRQVSWDWTYYYKIAYAMKQAAAQENVLIRWGGVWDRRLGDLHNDMRDEVETYKLRQKLIGKAAFLDGPHFELPAQLYK